MHGGNGGGGGEQEPVGKWAQRKEAKRNMYLTSTDNVRVTSRRVTGGSSAASAVAAQCQKCLQLGHWTYECKNDAIYLKRASRTQQLKHPQLRQPFNEDVPPGMDVQPGDAKAAKTKPAAKKREKKAEKKRKKRKAGSKRRKKRKYDSSSSDSSDSSSDSDSSGSSSDSDSDSSRSSRSSSSSSSSSSSDDSSSEDERDRKHRSKKRRKH